MGLTTDSMWRANVAICFVRFCYFFTCRFICGLRTWIDEQSGIFEIPNAFRTRHLHRLRNRSSGCWLDSHIKLRLAGCPMPIATCNLRDWNFRSRHHVAPRCRGLARSLSVPMTCERVWAAENLAASIHEFHRNRHRASRKTLFSDLS
jgi:hypothetical protein